VTTFLLRFPDPSPPDPSATERSGSRQPLRVAIKDIIDLEGTPTTGASRAVADRCSPAVSDADCLSHIRQAQHEGTLHIVGKTNLHELAFGGDGINPHYGTPVNPLDPLRVPGGSSSGSAVAVASGEADIAIGSDTGGSIRIPSHCCGVAGLKTTWGRVSLNGVMALSPFLDTLGPMARTVDDVITGMSLFEPGFRAEVERVSLRRRVAVLRGPGDFVADPGLDEAVANGLTRAGIEVIERSAAWWTDACQQGLTVLLGEAWSSLSHLLEREDRLDDKVAARIRLGEQIDPHTLAVARSWRPRLRGLLDTLLTDVDAVCLPSVPMFAPLVASPTAHLAPFTAYTRPANLAGTPALAVPLRLPPGVAAPEHAHLRGSLQIMGAAGSEATLCALGLLVEQAQG
jgi:amidase